MKTILLAKEEESVKEMIESLDVTVIAETGILDAVGQGTILRKAEIERRDFFYQFMKILERNGHTVYILGGTEHDVSVAEDYLTERYPRMKIVGTKAMEEIVGEEIGVVNDINMLAPDVVISVLPSPMQEQFLKEHKAMFLAKIWYGIGPERFAEQRVTFWDKCLKFIRNYNLKRYVKEDVEQSEVAEECIQDATESEDAWNQ